MRESPAFPSSVDLPSLLSELHIRGFGREKVGSALKCLQQVHMTQGFGAPDDGGVLVEDVVANYDLDVIQAASELFLEKRKVQGREVFTVRWGCDYVAEGVEAESWNRVSHRWEAYVRGLDDRYLGFLLPDGGPRARVLTEWQLNKELKWFSTEAPHQGKKMLEVLDDIGAEAGRLGLAQVFRPFGPEGVLSPRLLLHQRAFEALNSRRSPPPASAVRSVRLWRFFSEYDVNATNFVALMKECGLSLEEIVGQVGRFFELGLTSEYRDSQYPPYFIAFKKKDEFQAAVRDLLLPMGSWLSRGQRAVPAEAHSPAV